MYELIYMKRQGHSLTPEEIKSLVRDYTAGAIPDYQMAAFLMAVYFRGLSNAEMVELTLAMASSGEQVDLSGIPGVKVDKHSTGGVGDKTTLVVVPLVAAAGVPVAKMSGRGLGHTGGTVDKLESIPGMRMEMRTEQFIRQVRETGAAIVAQTDNLVPADKKLYALRDVTATVDSIPLIAASVMSKKFACGADAILLDVKTGRGAFMKEEKKAVDLARAMVAVGRLAGRKTVACVTDMEQPLGLAVGNALEVAEAVKVLQGGGPEDLKELSLLLGSRMLMLAGKAITQEHGIELLSNLLERGHALDKFGEIVAAQGGDRRIAGDTSVLPRASYVEPVKSTKSGYVQGMEASFIGKASVQLGAGRLTKDSAVDPAAGIVAHKKIGDRVKVGDTLAEIHAGRQELIRGAQDLVLAAYSIGEVRPRRRPLLRKVITEDDVKDFL